MAWCHDIFRTSTFHVHIEISWSDNKCIFITFWMILFSLKYLANSFSTFTLVMHFITVGSSITVIQNLVSNTLGTSLMKSRRKKPLGHKHKEICLIFMLNLNLKKLVHDNIYFSWMMFPVFCSTWTGNTEEPLYNTIYYARYHIQHAIDKCTVLLRLCTKKRHSIPRPYVRAMECLLWVF